MEQHIYEERADLKIGLWTLLRRLRRYFESDNDSTREVRELMLREEMERLDRVLKDIDRRTARMYYDER